MVRDFERASAAWLFSAIGLWGIACGDAQQKPAEGVLPSSVGSELPSVAPSSAAVGSQSSMTPGTVSVSSDPSSMQPTATGVSSALATVALTAPPPTALSASSTTTPVASETTSSQPSVSSSVQPAPSNSMVPPDVPTDDAPCAVPAFVFSDVTPTGWASESGGTTGGGNAEPVRVSSLSELQSAVSGTEPAVIYVEGDFPAGVVDVGSNKTILGCSNGARVHGHVSIGSGSANVIVRNMQISGYGAGDCTLDPGFNPDEGCSSGSDAVSVNGNAHHVWIDHCSVKDGTDGNLDITNEANFVTVSWTKFSYTPRTDDVGNDSTGASGHRYSNLVGGDDDPPKNWPDVVPLNVTWHHNWWADNVVERQPRVRYGRNHVFNNYYNSSVSNYCVRAGIEASILLQGNYFDGVDSPHQFNSDANKATAYIALGMDALENSYDQVSGDQATGGGGESFAPPYDFTVEAASGVPAAVMSGAGPQ